MQLMTNLVVELFAVFYAVRKFNRVGESVKPLRHSTISRFDQYRNRNSAA